MQRSLQPGFAGSGPDRSSVRLRTLIFLRWMAILGQIATIAVADRYFDLILPLGLCFLVIGVSVIANLLATFVYPESTRLSERAALLTLLFDTTQLAALIFLTGGLTNPFALLILVPVTISASVLRLRTTLGLGLFAVGYVTGAALYSLPILLADGTAFVIPPLFRFGFWLSIVVGIVFLGVYARRVATEMRAMADALLATQMALAREQKLTDLGGVVAAAAHELGTPLATIKLVSTELVEDLAGMPEALADVQLIREQADRCRDILRGMGRAGKDDLQLRQAPLEAILREAAEPHAARGKNLVFTVTPAAGATVRQPVILRRPEIVHGLRNLVQNAVDFAKTTVWIEADWSDDIITLRIIDDGDGFPSQVLGRIGDPFVRARRTAQDLHSRPDYEGMGLGLFIAKTLLERSGAELTFANSTDPFLSPEERPERCGAVVQAVWPTEALIAPVGITAAPNERFQA